MAILTAIACRERNTLDSMATACEVKAVGLFHAAYLTNLRILKILFRPFMAKALRQKRCFAKIDGKYSFVLWIINRLSENLERGQGQIF